MPRPFSKVAGLRPRRNVFDLSYDKRFDCDFGQLIPVMCDEVVPGDTFHIGTEVVVRFQPTIVPIMHEVEVFTHTFFVPYRLIWDPWEDYISGGINGQNTSIIPTYLPQTDFAAAGITTQQPPSAATEAVLRYTLWDYFGFPLDILARPVPTNEYSFTPIDFPWRAYNFVYNEYYRDQDLQTEVSLLNNKVLLRNWRKDYFSSSRPFQQRGEPAALPLAGNLPLTPAIVPAGVVPADASGNPIFSDPSLYRNVFGLYGSSGTQLVAPFSINPSLQGYSEAFFAANLAGVNADASGAVTFDVSDLRRVFQLQKWQERNARAGVRYIEFLKAHFGVHPRDERLQRPEYIGGTRNQITVSEIVQTSSPTAASPQGAMAGHGLHASGSYVGSYTAREFGIIITLMSVMPKPAYQDGVNRQWLRRSRYDFYFPEFAHLSEQGIYSAELRMVGSGFPSPGMPAFYDAVIFGFQGKYDEMRVKHDMICGAFRVSDFTGDLSYWHLGRHWPFAPDTARPALNPQFIQCDPDSGIGRIFAVSPSLVTGLLVNVRNNIRAVRPIPQVAEPGLVDHF